MTKKQPKKQKDRLIIDERIHVHDAELLNTDHELFVTMSASGADSTQLWTKNAPRVQVKHTMTARRIHCEYTWGE